MGYFSRATLPAVVFLTGACVLVIEVLAIRILSPYFGNTIFTISSVLSIILAALSCGYYVGGKFADRYGSKSQFFSIILLSGIAVLFFHALGTLSLPVFGLALPLTVGPLVFAAVLFLLPAFLLGMLSPYAIVLYNATLPPHRVGKAAGVIFFYSTFGSIVGSLLAGFVLIPHVGVNMLFLVTGAFLSLLGLIPLLSMGKKFLPLLLAFLGVFLAVWGARVGHAEDIGALYARDGVYERIKIADGIYNGRPARFFEQDRSLSGVMFTDTTNPTDLAAAYTKYYAVWPLFTPAITEAFIIGGGAYSLPKALHADLPDATITISEIEPSLVDLARIFFNLPDDSRLVHLLDDGRRILALSPKRYDLIFSDVFYSLYSIPAHFTTKEFLALAKGRLNPEGIFVVNLIGDLSRQAPSFFMSALRTFREVFPQSYAVAVTDPKLRGPQNIILIGHNSNQSVDLSQKTLADNPHEIIETLPAHLIDLDRFELSSHPLLTDDFAPVDYLIAPVLWRAREATPKINGEEMLEIIKQQVRYGPRIPGSAGHEHTTRFIAAEMGTYVDQVAIQTWNHQAQDGTVYPMTNIIARVHPEEDARIILATHYDTKAVANRDLTSPHMPVPGANDGASGVAVLMELARVLSLSGIAPGVGIDFVFFDGEEGDIALGSSYESWEPIGSTYFAENLKAFYPAELPRAAIVLDMVCDRDLRIEKEATSHAESPALSNAFFTTATNVEGSVFVDRVGQSVYDDHTPLQNAGIPSLLIIDLSYPPFHTTEDTPDKCSPTSLTAVAEAVLSHVLLTR